MKPEHGAAVLLLAIIGGCSWTLPHPSTVATIAASNDSTATALPYATDVRVKDGDTIEADVVLPWGVTLRDQDIRANDFDAWETSKRRKTIEYADDEIERGNRARDALAALLKTGRLILIPDEDEPRDNYGRILASWKIQRGDELVDVADIMEAGGHTREGEQ